MLLWTARQAGLTDDDLKRFTYSELDAWFEIYEWSNTKEEDDSVIPTAQATENAFFHLK